MAVSICVVGAGLAGAFAGRAALPLPVRVETGFLTPSGNIACNAGPFHSKPWIACTVFSESSPARGQKVWVMSTYGRASAGFVLGNAATDLPKLRYGRSWTWRGIRCTSERRGLTCRNRSGHGFFLSRGSQRLF